jgi:hypothetical protein
VVCPTTQNNDNNNNNNQSIKQTYGGEGTSILLGGSDGGTLEGNREHGCDYDCGSGGCC